MAHLEEVSPVLNKTITSETVNNLTTADCNFTSEGFTIFKTIACILIFAIGIILNSLAFWVYFCHIPNTNAIIFYLKNLVIADSLLVLSLPIKILKDNRPSANLNKAYCSFIACIFYLNMYSSVFFLAYIAATRYLKIVRPLRNYAFRNLKTAKRLSLGTWSILLLLAILFAILINKDNKPKLSNSPICLRDGVGQRAIYFFAHTAGLVMFFVVLAGICYCYLQISTQLHLLPSSPSLKKQTKAKNNILILLVVFFICFVPYHIIKLPYILSQTELISDCYWQRVLYYAKESSLLLSTLNACFDPVIYFLFCKAFRSKLGLDKRALEPNEISVPANASQVMLD
ncbi:P2Y purinoceptor 14-like [Leucoraja erinacea]|uniref:P2Y purinoceptor 14-like n=1 Tax=Leucoraja erinaceus TaxID=7782 RepID=UPI002457818C|nr:P2Y purinoceptor 14-like [Leucoraja erinacea]